MSNDQDRVGEDLFFMYAASHYLEVGEQCKWYRKKNKERAHGLYMNSAEHPSGKVSVVKVSPNEESSLKETKKVLTRRR